MGAMTIFAGGRENEVLTKQVAEFHLARVEFQVCRNFDHRRRRRNENPSPPPSSGWPWLSASSPPLLPSFRNFHPVKRPLQSVAAFRKSSRPDEIPTTVVEDTIGRPPSNLFVRGKGEGNLTSCPGAGK